MATEAREVGGMTAPPLILVCLDGGDERIVERLMADGRLPAFGELADRGAAVSIPTAGAVLPECVWGPALTGRSVGDHAFVHFHEFDPATMGLRFRREAEADLEPFWLHLPERGAGGVVLDVPELHPHPDSRAEEACCWHQQAAPHRPVVTSHRLRRLLAGAGRPPRLADPPYQREPSPGQDREISRHLVASGAYRGRTLARVGTDRPFTCLGVWETHTAVHALGHHWEPDHWYRAFDPEPELVEAVYVALDAALGPVLSRCGEANVVLVAARGMRPAAHGHHLLEGLLVRAGLCTMRANNDALAPSRGGDSRAGGATRLLRAGRALLPDRTREALATAVLPSALQHRLASPAFADRYDWSRTRAFPVPSWGLGCVRLNIAGREREGIVEPEEVEPLRRQVRELVEGLEHADTGRRLAHRVLSMQDAYPGGRSSALPDFGVEWSTGPGLVTRASHPRLGTWSAPVVSGHRWSEHDDRGLVLMAGPGVRARDATLEEELAGLAPTLLALGGVRRPSAMAGQPWGDVLTD